jgi:hypothetical protein
MKANFKLPLTGRCQCKSVSYKITSAPLATRAIAPNVSGNRAAHSAFRCLPTEVIDEGKPAIWERHHESGRVIDCVICANCGSRFFHEPRANTKITIVKAGSLDDTRWLFPLDISGRGARSPGWQFRRMPRTARCSLRTLGASSTPGGVIAPADYADFECSSQCSCPARPKAGPECGGSRRETT